MSSSASGAPSHGFPVGERKSDSATLPPPLTAKDPTGFAYKTVRERLAVILTKTMDTASNDAAAQMGPEACEETKLVVARLSKLRDEIAANKPLVALDDDFEDAAVWNAVLDKYTADGKGSPPRWYDAPWLYFETYFYRRIFGAFYMSGKLKDYDYFAKFKRDALDGAIDAVRVLIDSASSNAHRDAAPTALKQVTRRLIEMSLWGNRCDLSLSCGADASSQADALQQTDVLRPFIISNHTDKLLEHICKLRKRNLGGKLTQLHCVLDNSGYELSADLTLFDFLHVTGYVAGVTIHAKAIPYYVSDVMCRDVSWTLRKMQESKHEAMRVLGERCQHRISDGIWSVLDDIFWTQPFDYAHMATRRPQLYKILQSADLVFFKGDVNYRKLVGDLQWDPSVPFQQALRGFEPTFLCTLRTIKSNTVAGVDKSVVSEVAQRSPDWMITGEYAVIQCAGTAPRL
ncbi:damage-control phosphatase ARMT1-like [Dermacentor andersoni]|uniref:damage-control phosphatase ARMT1-like n=1 Tax=Dermacentor andersoni TaxID=34620 RepID=UPI00215562B1|nr:damage-control phosphatase ARMT1-like [Dermacentor andersoni]